MATLCPHGLDRDRCVICQALAGTTRGPVAEARPGAVASRRRAGPSLAVTVVGIVAVVVVGGVVVSAAFALLRIIELLVVAVVAGAAGYRIGVVRGRHRP